MGDGGVGVGDRRCPLAVKRGSPVPRRGASTHRGVEGRVVLGPHGVERDAQERHLDDLAGGERRVQLCRLEAAPGGSRGRDTVTAGTGPAARPPADGVHHGRAVHASTAAGVASVARLSWRAVSLMAAAGRYHRPGARRPGRGSGAPARSSAHRLLHQGADPRLLGGGQLGQREEAAHIVPSSRSPRR